MPIDVLHYQFAYYGPGTNLKPEPDVIGKLLSSLSGRGLIPTTATEIDTTVSLEPKLQLRFITPDQSWLLAFEQKRVMLRNERVRGVELGSPALFQTECTEIMNILLDEMALQGNRLSYVVRAFLPETSKESLDSAYSRLLRPIPFYQERAPVQWTTRSIANLRVDIGAESEMLNVIADINRVQGEIKSEDGGTTPFDRIELVLDINTHQDHTGLRFGASHISPFFAQAQELADRLTIEARGLTDE